MPTASSFGLKDFPKSVRTLWHCSRLRSVALTYDWSWWYPSGNRPLQQYLGFTAGRWLWSVRSIRLYSLIANLKKRAEWSERLMYEQSHSHYLRSGYLHHRLPVMGWRPLPVIMPLPTKPSATKIRTEAGERGNYWHADASAWCCCAWCKIHEGVSWC